MNNPNEVLLGSHGSSDFDSTCENGSAATFKAGMIVGLNSSGDVAIGDIMPIGVSMGESLADSSKISVCRSGNDIPVRLQADAFDSYDWAVIGETVYIKETGYAVSPFEEDTIATNAIYVSGKKDGISKGESIIPCALIDMAGGI